MQCNGRTTSSSSCSMSRTLTGKGTDVISVDCPPHNKKVSCKFMASEGNGHSCQYYKDSETGELVQFCCCYGKMCYQSPNRLEYEQRHFHELVVDPVTTVFFSLTFLINILTIKLFYNDLTNAAILIYRMHSDITLHKFRQPKRNLLENMDNKFILRNMRTLITSKMITFLMHSNNKQNINNAKFGVNVWYAKLEITKCSQERKHTEKKSWQTIMIGVNDYFDRNSTLMKVNYSYWRARERNQTGKQMRRTLKFLFEL
ncbi:hypothetical protein DINM_004394 [Dirofilaria immitis]|nr:hypothetical protein [Dirofilaria immitis]